MARPKKAPEPEENRVVRIAKSEERGAGLAQMWEIALPRIKEMVPQHVLPSRLLASLLTAVNRNPVLAECTAISLIRESIRAAQMGFDVSGIGGKAYLVPFFNKDIQAKEAQLITGYRGLEELARRTGQIAAIWSREIYEADEFAYEDGLVQIIRHIPKGPLTAEERPVGAYAVAMWTSGFRQGEVMNAVQIEKIRQTSKMPNGMLWTEHAGEAYRKTVTRRLCKRLPDSVELATQLDNEERMERGEVPLATIDIDQPRHDLGMLPSEQPKKSQTERIKEKLMDRGAQEAALEEEQVGLPMEPAEREPGEEG